MEYKLSWHFHIGRIALALAIIFFGYNIMLQGREFYVPLLHAWRRMLLPDSKNKINASLTYEELFLHVTQAMGGLMVFGGALIALNKRVAGGLFVLLALAFMVATQDNPMLIEYMKPKPQRNTIRLDDLARHISVIGAVLYLMIVPPVNDREDDHGDEGESKKTR